MSRLSSQVLIKKLQGREFTELFVEDLGWDRLRNAPDVVLDVRGTPERLRPVAQKRSVPLYLYRAASLPDRVRRRAIEAALARQQREHLVVFADDASGAQVWQWVKREPGRPDRLREHAWRPGDDPEGLRQKLDALQFTLEEEDAGRITGALDVTDRLRRAFDADEVTKRFYDAFKAQHDALMAFLRGLPDDGTRSWYASVTLNRLMFIYFIQKKGFLNGDLDYLNRQLSRSLQERGRDRFFADFLCPLFFRGFALPESQRSTADRALLGPVPYLNGGLFQEHQIEREHGERIALPDKAFVDLFAFFDGWRWHLDERRTGEADDAPATGREINPDVLGYIFEKYVNQKQMGAYYTKEDVTEYICANTILPRLLDKVAAEVRPAAFAGPDSLWRLLGQDPDRYIWPSIRHGDGLPLPEKVAAGVMDVARREAWGQHATRDLGLPTETWREVIHRRARLEALRAQLRAGAITSPDAMVTANLDLARFAADAISEASEDGIKAWWAALKTLTVLDPACGSGAFLFAALNLLEPLYTAVFEAMQTMVADARRTAEAAGRSFDTRRYDAFTKVLEEAARHPNAAYFVLRQIALNNLFGVDLMEEAAEICKLRMFLKLVAQLDDPRHIEPLPDLDFNIRSGNSLVGFASEAALDAAEQGELDLSGAAARIKEGAEIAARAYRRFQEMQERAPLDAQELAAVKEELRTRLEQVAAEADELLAWHYGVPKDRPRQLAAWRRSHAPFHWATQFFSVMHDGGFDAVVGNPPYVRSSKITSYAVRGATTRACPDIYAWFQERAASLTRERGWTGMIVPLSLGFSRQFAALRTLITQSYGRNWFSHFGRIPAALFAHDVRVRNVIHIGQRGGQPAPSMTTRLHRWNEEARPYLLSSLAYTSFASARWPGVVPKLSSERLIRAFEAARQGPTTVSHTLSSSRTRFPVHYKKTAYNWIAFSDEAPPCFDRAGRAIPQAQSAEIYAADDATRRESMCLLNGKIALLWWVAVGDDFHVTASMFGSMPIPTLDDELRSRLGDLPDRLIRAMHANIAFKLNAGKRVGNFNLMRCRHITDVSDQVFAEAMGFDADDMQEIELMYAQVIRTRIEGGVEDGELEPDAAELD
jgi:hypothetical protein